MRRAIAAASTCAAVLCLCSQASQTAHALGGGTSTIGDFVWLDRDRDGVQDAGEPGVPGVRVDLWQFGEFIRSETTDSDGFYLFTEVEGSEDTHLVFNLPPGYAFTSKDQGGDDAKDSDANASTGETDTFLISAEQVDLTWDAGLTLSSVGDFVWVDDGDGIQESGEAGKKGVVVELLDASGATVLGSTTTDDDGKYLFSDLVAGDYRLRFLPPAGYTIAPQDQGSDDAADSDADVGTGVTSSFTLTGDDVTRDAGLIAPPAPRFAVGDFVWVDDGNGVQDSGEPGLDGVTVELLDGSTFAVLDTQVTSGGGAYHFTDLLEGDYRVRFVLPSSYSFAPKDQGGDDAKDNDADTTTGTTVSFHLDHNDDSRDAGLVAPPAPRYSVGDFVWEDGSDGVGDGVQGATEPGIDGLTVELLDSTDSVVATTTTSGGGKYLFTNLLAGDYRIRFTLKPGYSFSTKDQGGDDAKDSDADTATGTTASFHLAGDDLTRDAGMVPPALPRYSVGDFVWEDGTDGTGNGIQGAGEPGLDGITVDLLGGSSNTVLATTTTSGGGYYLFSNLLEGDYRILFHLRSGYAFSPLDQGGDDTKDSDANTSTGVTASFHLNSNETTRDAGMVPPPAPRYALGDFVWLDNGNGIQDAGEAGVGNVTVQLLDGTTSAVLGTTTTSGSGAYGFSNLLEGDYRVKFVLPGGGYTFAPQAQGGNDAKDSDANVGTGITIPFHLNSNDSTRDAGLLPPPPPRYCLGDFVWSDTNGNGVQNSGEPGIDGLTVQLFDGAGTTLIATTTTAGGGKYLFSNLLEGDYRVKFFLKSGYSFSPIDQGGNDATDSDASTTTGVTASFHLGSNDLTRDAGLVPPPAPRFSLGDYVWRDLNGDGVQDASEPGRDGVTVQLLGATGTTVLATTTTSGGGKYLFTNLLEGDYRVKFVLPSGLAFTSKDASSNDAIDSDADTSTGITATFHLNGNDLTRDAGLVCSAGGGHTPGFWQNKNGQALIDCSDLTYLRTLCLVTASGSSFDPTTAPQLGCWITSDAVNMAYKLSTFTAAMSLNVRHGFVNSSATVYTGDCASNLGASTMTIANLLKMANDDLCTKGHNYTVTSSSIRTRQECIKVVLDRACNNLNWVNP